MALMVANDVADLRLSTVDCRASCLKSQTGK
jgi:hypothetical protein